MDTGLATGTGMAHGGRLRAAQALHPGAPLPWIDLSTGINPVPYPVPTLPATAWSRLPEPEDVLSLEAAAAAAYGVDDPAMVVAAPGTQALIGLLPYLAPQRRISVLGPTYAEHAAAWAAAGADVTAVEDPGALAGAPAVVLCNPNNPDGRRICTADLLTLSARTGLLVVDEAFMDFEGPGLAPVLPGNAVVLRSFGKTYGLAGLRLGFAVALPGLAARLRVALGPWAVNGPAVAIATAALHDRAWLERARARLDTDGGRLDALLGGSGITIVGGTRLFRLARSPDAPAIARRLSGAGILVRPFADRPDWLRFGIPAGGWDRLSAALA
ncbi:MAG: threonine-phosphate decarboxylase [Gemmatimonadaceae bacterium]|nr:threonine-phosphate decarboxylase [Acetobacteraceae bacterium]